jgi:hypothetical protein
MRLEEPTMKPIPPAMPHDKTPILMPDFASAPEAARPRAANPAIIKAILRMFFSYLLVKT